MQNINIAPNQIQEEDRDKFIAPENPTIRTNVITSEPARRKSLQDSKALDELLNRIIT